MKKVVIDTGPLLAFAKAGIVDALKNLFKQLIITQVLQQKAQAPKRDLDKDWPAPYFSYHHVVVFCHYAAIKILLISMVNFLFS